MEEYTPTRLAEEIPEPPKRARKKKEKKPGGKRKMALLLVILLAILAVAAALAVAAYQGALGIDPAILPDLYAKNGTLYAENPDTQVESGTYRYVINQQPVMTVGAQTCNLELENVSGNQYDVQVTLTLADTGEELWSSHRVATGKYVETVTLSRDFKPGEYPVRANYRFMEGNEEIGAQSIDITLYVKAGE